jgi:hypothetical protein
MPSILIDHRAMCKPDDKWSEADLKKGKLVLRIEWNQTPLHGIEWHSGTDPFPAKYHYKPLLKSVKKRRMQQSVWSQEARIDKASGQVNFNFSKFPKAIDSRCTEIECPSKNHSVPIPEDCFVKQGGVFSITQNFGFLDARLESRSVDGPVAELFLEAGYYEELAYDPKLVLEEDIEHCYPEHEETKSQMRSRVPGAAKEHGLEL